MEKIKMFNTIFAAMTTAVETSFTHHIDASKFLLFKLEECPDNYLKSIERDEFFEIIWSWDADNVGELTSETNPSMYLIPPFRGLDVNLNGKEGYLIAFKREYLEEDDKEYALDVFKLFNLQGQHSLILLDANTQKNIHHIHALMMNETDHPSGTYLVLKSLLKVLLMHLIRLNQSSFRHQDVNQKRVYEFCMLLDQNYISERKASFYASQIGISEKRLNQILQAKMNKTITQLVHTRLILEAKRKLTAGDLTIKELSYYLHFEDHSYFSRFFKKQTGLSPEDFKRK